MIKNLAALILCAASLTLSSASAVEGSKTFSAPHGGDAPGVLRRFCSAQEPGQSISLPQANGSWLLEMSRSGGMRPGKQQVQINSDGEISVTSEHYTRGRVTVECSLKAKLSAGDLLKLKESVRSSQVSAWRENYDDPKHPVCCDQPTTELTLHWRQPGGAKASHKTSWYPGSSQLRPADLVEVATTGQTLWNKTSERCADHRAKD